MKKILVDKCDNCPFMIHRTGTNAVPNQFLYCGKMQEKDYIEDRNQLPAWCPLEENTTGNMYLA